MALAGRGRPITCGVGRNILLYGSKQAAWEMRNKPSARPDNPSACQRAAKAKMRWRSCQVTLSNWCRGPEVSPQRTIWRDRTCWDFLGLGAFAVGLQAMLAGKD